MTRKIRCALIGPGNIGTDLLAKLMRSPVLEPVWMVGIDPDSDGLKRARELGLKTTAEGVDGLLPHVQADGVQIAFDATSAYVHAENSRKLNALGVLMIDLTPAAIGPYCVPPVNLKDHIGSGGLQRTNTLVQRIAEIVGIDRSHSIDGSGLPDDQSRPLCFYQLNESSGSIFGGFRGL